MKSLFNVIAPALLAAGLVGCNSNPPGSFQGYVEGEYVSIAAPLGGSLTQLAVSRGQTVTNGQLLFALDPQPEAAALEQARSQFAQAQAQLEDLTKGRRPTEIAAMEAQLTSARADLELAQSDFDRREKLGQSEVASREELDRARARKDAAQAQVEQLTANLETARLGAREDAIAAAKTGVAAQKAVVVKAQWALEQKQQFAPAAAAVHDTFYRPGEFVGAGNPVLSLLPPENLKVRFFIPESMLPKIAVGQAVEIHIDGSDRGLAGTINYISTKAEYTPPMIYSRENRASLVYMIEAKIAAGDAPRARPGQPVDVRMN